MITKLRDPFAYIGALYPFEGLTPLISQLAKTALAGKNFPENALEYLEFHSTEDIKHADLLKAMIKKTVTRFPQSGESIVDGMNYFLAVYPLPVWSTALARARLAQG